MKRRGMFQWVFSPIIQFFYPSVMSITFPFFFSGEDFDRLFAINSANEIVEAYFNYHFLIFFINILIRKTIFNFFIRLI
jgi:hypothetical protein